MDYEEMLKTKILPELEAGRPNWDKPHTEAVVAYVKSILDNTPSLNVDRVVLVIAAYAHDWGYAGLFSNGKQLNIDDVNNAKARHMQLSADKLREFLTDSGFDFMSDKQKERAIHLVSCHDNLESLKDTDELVLMEADTLGWLDVAKVKPSFDKVSNQKYMEGVRSKRLPLFITEYGRHVFETLYQSREKYYLALGS